MKPTISVFIATSLAMTLFAKHPVPQECLRTSIIPFVSRLSGHNLTGVFDSSIKSYPFLNYINCRHDCYWLSPSQS